MVFIHSQFEYLTGVVECISFQGQGHGRETKSTNDGLPHLFAELFRPLEAKGRRASKWRESTARWTGDRQTEERAEGVECQCTRVEWKFYRSRLQSWELQCKRFRNTRTKSAISSLSKQRLLLQLLKGVFFLTALDKR